MRSPTLSDVLLRVVVREKRLNNANVFMTVNLCTVVTILVSLIGIYCNCTMCIIVIDIMCMCNSYNVYHFRNAYPCSRADVIIHISQLPIHVAGLMCIIYTRCRADVYYISMFQG